jgi:hypothetical protein
LQPYADRAGKSIPTDRQAYRIKNPQGGATPATPGATAKTVIFNTSVSRRTKTPDPLGRYGLPGLEAAVRAETADMEAYIERKMKASADACGIKTN